MFKKLEIPGLKFVPYEYENKTSKFDLTLIGVEVEERIAVSRLNTVQNYLKRKPSNGLFIYFKNIVNGVIENKDRRISDFEIITEEEKKRILFDFNNTEAEYPKIKPSTDYLKNRWKEPRIALRLFGPRANIAEYGQRYGMITYHELNEQSGDWPGC